MEPECDFPLAYYEEFLQQIQRRGIQTLTYADLFEDVDDYDAENGFPLERQHWDRTRDKNTIYLLIQHDIDNYPSFTERIVNLERQYEVVSNIFMFVNRASAGKPDPSYRVDHDFFTRAEKDGYVIGYHQNALSLTGTTVAEAQKRFASDVRDLRKHYSIDFVVPHGGRALEVGGHQLHNHDIPIPTEIAGTIRWVYNKYGVKFDRRWSDGGLRKNRDAKKLREMDLTGTFLPSLKEGSRNFCLIHPQRWGLNFNANLNPILAQMSWHKEMSKRFA